MSRTAAAYLATPLAQLENMGSLHIVFERNTHAQIENALRFIQPTPDVIYQAELLRVAAGEVVSTYGEETRHEAAKADFIALTGELRTAILNLPGTRGATKQREIAALGV